MTVLDKWGFSHTATITGLSGEAVDVAAGWTGLFPEFKYTAGAGERSPELRPRELPGTAAVLRAQW